MTTWSPPSRSPEAASVYAAAEADRQAQPERYRLDEDIVIERATRNGRAATSTFADDWADGLRHYLASAREDGRLNAVGVRMVIETAAAKLSAGSRIAAYIAEHPGRATASLIPPIVIVGGWRTGTTFLFRLLATDPRLRAPLPVELAEPWRMADPTGSEREARIDASARAHDFLHLLNPQMRAVHDSGARLPEECVLAMGTDLRNWGFTSTVRLDAYARWLAGQDLEGSYRRYRQILQILGPAASISSAGPLPDGSLQGSSSNTRPDTNDGRRFLLKAPAHVAELDHLVSTFPGAVIVHLHRDIVETIASGASLFAVFRSTYSDAVDPVDVGHFQADQTELWLRRAVEYRTTRASAAATFVDLDYRELVADPAAAASKVYSAAGMEFPADFSRLIADYHARNPRNAHGTHTYTAADFGLDPHELRERFSFLEAIGGHNEEKRP